MRPVDRWLCNVLGQKQLRPGDRAASGRARRPGRLVGGGPQHVCPVGGWLSVLLGIRRLQSDDRSCCSSCGGPTRSGRVLLARVRTVGWRQIDLLGQPASCYRAPCGCGNEPRGGLCRGSPHMQPVIVWRCGLLGCGPRWSDECAGRCHRSSPLPPDHSHGDHVYCHSHCKWHAKRHGGTHDNTHALGHTLGVVNSRLHGLVDGVADRLAHRQRHRHAL